MYKISLFSHNFGAFHVTFSVTLVLPLESLFWMPFWASIKSLKRCRSSFNSHSFMLKADWVSHYGREIEKKFKNCSKLLRFGLSGIINIDVQKTFSTWMNQYRYWFPSIALQGYQRGCNCILSFLFLGFAPIEK